jgi:glycosyltransferase involved in cell wall biosynthesis
MRIGYFTNQYPAVSHTFIRREIVALESLGETVKRYALFCVPDKLVHEEDKAELAKTKLVFKVKPLEALRILVSTVVLHPIVTFKVVVAAIRMGWFSDRGLMRHFAYVAEAMILADWCKRDSIEHLHAHFGTNSAAIAMFAAMLSGIPYSFTAHGCEEFEKAPILALDTKLRNSAFGVCVSAFGRSQLMRWSPPELWHKVHVVHCGLDASYVNAAATPPPDRPRVACVGRLGEHKAQLVLVEAVDILHKQGIDCEVVLAGDGPMRPNIEAAVKAAGIERLVTITGWIPSDQVRAHVAAARALVLPSFAENMPVVIMEAFAQGRTVISTYIAGIPELVQPNKTGWLVPSGDATALAEAIKDMLATPVDRLAAMGAAGRAHILANHDALTEARKLKQLFERV